MYEWRWPPRVLSLTSLLWLCACSGFWVYLFHFCWFCLFKSAMVHCCCCRGLPCLSHPKSFLFPSWDLCSVLAGIKHHTVVGWRARNRKLKGYNTTEGKKSFQKLGGDGPGREDWLEQRLLWPLAMATLITRAQNFCLWAFSVLRLLPLVSEFSF